MQMWVYGGWSEASEHSLGDMHVLHMEDDNLRWEDIRQGGLEMEARSWHSVGVYGDEMLLYGDKGECAQSAANMSAVFAFNFAKRTWRMQHCSGAVPASVIITLTTALHGRVRFDCVFWIKALEQEWK